MSNPLYGWRLDPTSISTTGTGLRRPECVLAERNGTLWAADLRGGVLRVDPDGAQHVVSPVGGGGPFAPEPFEPGVIPDGTEGLSLPNGLAIDRDGSFVIANFGTRVLERLTRAGAHAVLLDQLDGQSLGQTNFVLRDSRGRLWFTVTTRQHLWTRMGRERIRDGYVGVIDSGGARIVADNFFGTNEVRLDPAEEWLYVVETAGNHISRLRVGASGALTDREVYGPDDLGGRPDGMTFDAYGNLWITLVSHDRLIALTPEGDVLTIWEDGDPHAKADRDRAELSGSATPAQIQAARGHLAPRMAIGVACGPGARPRVRCPDAGARPRSRRGARRHRHRRRLPALRPGHRPGSPRRGPLTPGGRASDGPRPVRRADRLRTHRRQPPPRLRRAGRRRARRADRHPRRPARHGHLQRRPATLPGLSCA